MRELCRDFSFCFACHDLFSTDTPSAVLIASANDLPDLVTPYQVPVNIKIPTFSVQRSFVAKFVSDEWPTSVRLPTLRRLQAHVASECIGCSQVDLALGPAFRAAPLGEAPSLLLRFEGVQESSAECLAEVNSLILRRADDILSNVSQIISAAPFWEKWARQTDPCSLHRLTAMAQAEYRNAWSRETILALGVTPQAPGWTIANNCLHGFQQAKFDVCSEGMGGMEVGRNEHFE